LASLILTNNHTDTTLTKFINGVKRGSKTTADNYSRRLESFRLFVKQKYNLTLDELILTLTTYSSGPKIDPYELLSDYMDYINEQSNISPLTLKLKLSTVRCYLETFDIELSSKKLRYKVRMPRIISEDKEPLSKADVQTIINACPTLKLKTYVMFLASTGCRATEALSIKGRDINWNNNPVTISMDGRHTKTKKSFIIFLTKEMEQQLKLWIQYKHRRRDRSYY